MRGSARLILLASLLLLFACGKDRKRSPAEAESKSTAPAAVAPAALVPVKVLVPRQGHLQYMSFYLARGAGYFADEGLDVEPIYPPSPRDTKQWFEDHEGYVAVLPPPMCLELIADGFEFEVFANLLANDPIEMLVRKSIAEQRKLSPTAPLRERLAGLHGLRVGVSPNPPTRLRKLFAANGLDADKEIQIVVIRGEQHNQVFADGKVDALYVHTPFLERALVSQDAMMLIDQSAGEVPELSGRQIHTLAVERDWADSHPEIVTKLARAIVRAGKLVHGDQKAAVAALARELPERSQAELETIVRIYAPAIPEPPTVSAAGFGPALDYYPATRTPPDLTGIELEPFVATRFVTAALQSEDSAAAAGSGAAPAGHSALAE